MKLVFDWAFEANARDAMIAFATSPDQGGARTFPPLPNYRFNSTLKHIMQGLLGSEFFGECVIH